MYKLPLSDKVLEREIGSVKRDFLVRQRFKLAQKRPSRSTPFRRISSDVP